MNNAFNVRIVVWYLMIHRFISFLPVQKCFIKLEFEEIWQCFITFEKINVIVTTMLLLRNLHLTRISRLTSWITAIWGLYGLNDDSRIAEIDTYFNQFYSLVEKLNKNMKHEPELMNIPTNYITTNHIQLNWITLFNSSVTLRSN